jgi:hypothetical protein
MLTNSKKKTELMSYLTSLLVFSLQGENEHKRVKNGTNMVQKDLKLERGWGRRMCASHSRPVAPILSHPKNNGKGDFHGKSGRGHCCQFSVLST